MKILWVGPGLLQPATRGGQIRTLELLRRLKRRHETHYVALYSAADTDLAGQSEYCSKAWAVPQVLAPRESLRFWAQTALSVFSRLPVVIARKKSRVASAWLRKVLREHNFDLVICDFLTPAIHIPATQSFVLFEHNVETMLWRRYAEHATNPVSRFFLRLQEKRMFEFERSVCRRATRVIAVSKADADTLRQMCGISQVDAIPTGVDALWFAPPSASKPNPSSDLVFVGSMDWLPNIDGVRWFVESVLPLIRIRLPQCSLTIVGRRPARQIRGLARFDSRIRVTGTVTDIRPYLWSALVSIVPLRIAGGTRLKIYEAMAAGVPVVSTTVGAEGLNISSPENIRIADAAQAFADACVHLFGDPAERARQAGSAMALVREQFSWETAAARFEEIALRTDHLKLGGTVS